MIEVGSTGPNSGAAMRTTHGAPCGVPDARNLVLLPHDLGSAEYENAVRPAHRFLEGIDEDLGDWRQVRRWTAGSCIEFSPEHRPQFAGQSLLARHRRPPILPRILDIASVIALRSKCGDQASLVAAL